MARKKSQSTSAQWGKRNSGSSLAVTKAVRKVSTEANSVTANAWRNASRNRGQAFAANTKQRKPSNAHSCTSVEEVGDVKTSPARVRRISGAPSIQATRVPLRRKKSSFAGEAAKVTVDAVPGKDAASGSSTLPHPGVNYSKTESPYKSPANVILRTIPNESNSQPRHESPR